MTLPSSAASTEVKICAILAEPIAQPRPMIPAKSVLSGTFRACVWRRCCSSSGQTSRRSVAAQRHVRSFFERDAPPVEEAPQRPNADADTACLQLLLKLDERDVRRLCDLGKEEGRFGFDTARLAGRRQPLCRDVALLRQLGTPADRARRLTPNRSAAWRHERPISMASTTLWRRSTEEPWPCMPALMTPLIFKWPRKYLRRPGFRRAFQRTARSMAVIGPLAL